MSQSSIDPVEYKARLRRAWDSTAAARHQEWETFERAGQPVSDRLIELAELRAGQRVLDLATGIGEPALTAARRVGPAGQVVAIDLSPRMLEIARERAARLGLRNVDIREMDAEALDLPESAFDAILCRWGLFLVLDLPAALAGIRRRLIPGGRFAAAVFGPPAKVPFMSLALTVARQMLHVPPPPADTPGPFSLADVGRLERTFAEAGFVGFRTERMTITYEYASPKAYAHWCRETQAGCAALLANEPTERQADVLEAVAQAARQYALADGRVQMPNECILVGARRPERWSDR